MFINVWPSSLFLQIVIIWAVYSPITLRLLLLVYNCKNYHLNNEVSLEGKSCKIAHRSRIILKLYNKLIIFEALDDFFNHRYMIRVTSMVFPAIIQYILNKVEFYHSGLSNFITGLLSVLLYRKEQEWIYPAIFNSSSYIHILACN
jgi:hypothetical protein